MCKENSPESKDAKLLRMVAHVMAEGGFVPPSLSVTPSFWLVWRDGSRRGWNEHIPTARHDTYESAEREAKRLAALAPGEKFFVLPASAYAVAEVNPVRMSTDKRTGGSRALEEVIHNSSRDSVTTDPF